MSKRDKRLKSLDELWYKEVDEKWMGVEERLSPADLRLMLEQYEPLRKMIRDIVAGTPSYSSDHDCTSVVDVQPYQQKIQALEKELANARQALAEQQNKATDYSNQLSQVSQDLQRSQQQLAALQSQNSMGSAGTVLQFLLQDNTLQQRLGLDPLSDNLESAFKVVAVLSQWTSIERLHKALKERCDSRRSAASLEEKHLLETALAWHNHNWRQKPYLLAEPASGSAYNYENQQRCAATPAGETITQTWLPGIQGKSSVLPLVETR